VLPPAPFDDDGTYLGDGWTDPAYERETSALRTRMRAETSRAAPAAIAWAHDAGLHPGTPEEVTAALTGHEVFVEDLFFALINRLGIATDEVEVPVRPPIVKVLRSLFGHRLNAVDTTPHRPARGERPAFPGMPDLRLHFDAQATLTACGCGDEFSLLPTGESDEPVQAPRQSVDGSPIHAFADVLGRRLTDATTVRHRYLRHLKGVVLRFDDRDLSITAIDGRWTIAEGPTPDKPGSHRHADTHVNAWLTTL
jgi:hypothetical protein